MQTKAIIVSLMALTFILIVGIVTRYTGALDVTTSVEITNAAPTIDSIFFSAAAYAGTQDFASGIVPALGVDKEVHINGIITDLNGDVDVSTTTLVFFRTKAKNTCTDDKNSCYRATCAINQAAGSATEVAYNCPLSLSYFIDATETGSRYANDNWTAQIVTSDIASLTATSTATQEVNQLLGLNIPSTINYGTFSLGEETSSSTNQVMTFTQQGNARANVEVFGTAMMCNALGTLPVGQQRYSIHNLGHTESNALTSANTKAERFVTYRNEDTTELTRNLYWNIAIPQTGVRGLCAGASTVSIVSLPAFIGAGRPWKYDEAKYDIHKGALNENSWEIVSGTLPGPLLSSDVVIAGEYIYLYGGGIAAGTYTNNIYRAPKNSPTSWSTIGSVPNSCGYSQNMVIGEYVYIFGGYNCSVYTNVIKRAPIADQTSWTDVGTLPAANGRSQAIVIDDYIYLFGGVMTAGQHTATIYRASVSNPAVWIDTGATLPGATGFAQAALIDDYVYLFGGLTGSNTPTNIIYRAPRSNPTAWVNTGATLPAVLYGSHFVPVGDYLYLFGGRTPTGYTNAIYRAPRSSPTSWSNAGTLPTALGHSHPVVIEDDVYLFGGGNNGSAFTNAIYHATITP